jgi:hypothetical protein
MTKDEANRAVVAWKWQRYCRNHPYVDPKDKDAYAVFRVLDRMGLNRKYD